MAEFRINVVIDPSGARRGASAVNNALDRTNRNADRLGQTISNVFAFAGIAAGLRQLQLLTDTFTTVQNRIRSVITDTNALSVATDELFRIAANTRTGFRETAEAFSRVALSTRQLGVSQRESLDLTETLNRAIILSGASAQEASAGAIQFAQGLSSGRLSGDELRSVLEQLPVVADIIAERFGVTRGELRELGEQGRITSDELVAAFRDAREEIAERFARTVPTVGQAFQVLRNEIIRTVGTIDQANGISEAFARTLISVALEMDTLVRVAESLAAVLALGLARGGLMLVARALSAVTSAFRASPFRVIAGLIATAGAAATGFNDEIALTRDGMITLEGVSRTVLNRITRLTNRTTDALRELRQELRDQEEGSFLTQIIDFLDFDRVAALRAFADFQDLGLRALAGISSSFIAFFANLPNAVVDFLIQAFNGAIIVIENFIQGHANAIQIAVNAVITGINQLSSFLDFDPIAPFEIGTINLGRLENEYRGAYLNLGRFVSEAFIDGFNNPITGRNPFREFLDGLLQEAQEESGTVVNDLTEALNEQELLRRERQGRASLERETTPEVSISTQVSERVRALREEADLLRIVGSEREIQNAILQVSRDLRRELNPLELEALENQLRINQQLTLQNELYQELAGPEEARIQRLRTLNELFEQNRISVEQYNQELRNIELGRLDEQTDLLSGLRRGFIRLEDSVDDVATIAENQLTRGIQGFGDALFDTLSSGENRFRSFARTIIAEIGRIAARAAVLQIFSAAFGGGLGGGAGGVAGGAAGLGLGGGPAPAAPVFAQNGASFTVGGSGGTDSQFVPLRVTPGELVTVETPMQQRLRERNDEQSTTTQEPAINIINVMSEEEINQALATPRGERTIVNLIQRNVSEISNILNSGG